MSEKQNPRKMANTINRVQPGRIRVLKKGSRPSDQKVGPVVYWMFRDQRVRDNWALFHAIDEANKANVSVAVAFNLFDQLSGEKARQLGFMLRGLQHLCRNLETFFHIPFFFFQGRAEETIPSFLTECGASLLVTDFSPLRELRTCKEEICRRVENTVSVHEVDAHNIVPIWVASKKLEKSAATLRAKMKTQLPKYLIEFPQLKSPEIKWGPTNRLIDWDALIAEVLRKGADVPEIEWCVPGEIAAIRTLIGFLMRKLMFYSIERNNPVKPMALSGLSPYMHFGQISSQRCALHAHTVRNLNPQVAQVAQSVDAFLENLIIRRELADNYCFYQPDYGSLKGAWDWAQKTLMDHAGDKRELIYTRQQLEKGKTSDQLWNAAQMEMVHFGKMHSFMRMYWAKKILEWTNGPEEALDVSIYLNDKYEVDGMDPCGYVGCMWAICGIHDQGRGERPIFGKIPRINYADCKKKFDVEGYIKLINKVYIRKLLNESSRKRKAEELLAEIAKKQSS